MNYDVLLSRNKQFELPSDEKISEMDLIDLRRKIMKWCAKSQGAVGPCRSCPSKCTAGIRAIALYDGIDAPKASEPEVNVSEEKVEIKKEVTKMKREKPVAKWYQDAKASEDPVKWCVENMGMTEQQAKKRLYMYEYNRFGIRRSTTVEKQEVKATPEPVVKTSVDDISLMAAMDAKMKVLTERQQSCKVRIDELTAEYKKITDQLEAISICIDVLAEKTVS